MNNLITINLKPLSVNEAWQGKRFKTPAYKAFEEAALLMLPKQVEIPAGDLAVSLEFGLSNKMADLDNPVKPWMDILQKRYGFNDARVTAYSLRKCDVPKGAEYVAFRIEQDTSHEP